MLENNNKKNPIPFFGIFSLILAGEAIFLLPYVIARVFRPVLLQVFDFTHTQLGVAMSMYGITAVFAYVIGGPFADKYKPKRLIAISLAITALGGIFMQTIPSFSNMMALFAFWGVSTILLFWSSLIKLTRSFGGSESQGKAFGWLDGGRGLFSALIATFSVAIFAIIMPEHIESATPLERETALRYVIWFITGFVFLVAVIIWFFLPENKNEEKVDHINPKDFLYLAKKPVVWLQAIIIVSAYVGYKAVNDFSQYSVDILNMNDVESAQIGTLAIWIRPVAAVLAGYLADRFKASTLMIFSFMLIAIGTLTFATGIVSSELLTLFFTAFVAACIGIYAMRSLYFAIMEEGNIPLVYTGTVVGIVSVIGYTPDIFMYPLQGYYLDTFPGLLGHQYFFATVGGFALVGLLASVLFIRITKTNSADK